MRVQSAETKMFGLFKSQSAKEISPAEAQKRALAGEIRLVDVREHREWIESHIQGALHMPLSAIADRIGKLPSDKPVVFYCLSGARSATAVATCQKLGLPHDTHVTGGIKAWAASGLPIMR